MGTGEITTPGEEYAADLLLSEIFIVPEITSNDALRTSIFAEISEDIAISNCGTAACMVRSVTTDASGNRVRTADIYLSESVHGSADLIDLSGSRAIKFNTCPDYPDGRRSDPYNYPYSSLVHEAGHALGIRHPDIRDSIVNYYTTEPDCSPHPFDILAIYALYQSVD